MGQLPHDGPPKATQAYAPVAREVKVLSPPGARALAGASLLDCGVGPGLISTTATKPPAGLPGKGRAAEKWHNTYEEGAKELYEINLIDRLAAWKASP